MTNPAPFEERATREILVAALMTEMRTPLARVELAADQLLREAATPTARRLAQRVSEGVLELDALLGKSSALLMPSAAGSRCHQALAPVFESLRRRLAPVCDSLGVRWNSLPGVLAERVGDARALERSVLIALRAARELARQNASAAFAAALEPVVEEPRCAVALSWTESDESTSVAERSHSRFRSMTGEPQLLSGVWRELEESVLRASGELELHRFGARLQLRVWLDQRAVEPLREATTDRSME